jgi:hypothetical protein
MWETGWVRAWTVRDGQTVTLDEFDGTAAIGQRDAVGKIPIPRSALAVHAPAPCVRVRVSGAIVRPS